MNTKAGERREIGSPRSRADGPAKVKGGAKYVGDVPAPGLCHAVMATSGIAHGRVLSINTDRAMRLPGVLAVLTYRNFPKLTPVPVLLQAGGNRRDPKGSAGQQRLPLQDDRVECPGEPVAVVIAETLEQAQHGAAVLSIHYQQEQAIISFDEAQKNKFAPKDVWGDETDYQRGDVAGGLKAAAVTIEQTYHTQMQHHVTMEPHGAMASWDQGKLTVYQTTTWVGGGRKTLAAWFGLREADVRIRNDFVGGSFGSKGPTWPHVGICAAAALHVKRPVRLVLSRQQTFTDAGRRPELRHAIRLAADGAGKLTAFTYDTVAETAVFDDRVVAPTTRTPPRLYACKNVATTYRLCHLHRNGPFTMRGPGETPALFALESAMDELAYALKLDPIELRLRNHADQDPTAEQPWSSKHLRECYAQGAERFGWAKRTPEPRSMREGNELVGYGMATMIYDARSAAAQATATIDGDGHVVLRSATVDPGTGQYTILPQIAADALQFPVDRIRLELGDTDFPQAPLVAGSQTTATLGVAVQNAAADLRHTLVTAAIGTPASPLYALQESEIQLQPDGLHGGEITLPYSDLLRLLKKTELVGHGEAKAIKETEKVSRFSFGAHFAEVRVRPDTGELRVSRYVAAFAAGRIINPKTADSQLIGGIIWGIGQALMEKTDVDPVTGRYTNPNLADYLVPTHADVPAIDAFFLEERDDKVNPLGVKGVGEIGTIGAAPAIANAVFHATGRRCRRLPIRLETLL